KRKEKKRNRFWVRIFSSHSHRHTNTFSNRTSCVVIKDKYSNKHVFLGITCEHLQNIYLHNF
ncbi:unnamed protein product, partial [Arabidopsis halleri]